MRESVVICPVTDNDGRSLEALRDLATMALADRFGGCTVREARGCWVCPKGKLYSERVWELVSAYEPSAAHNAALRRIALMIGIEGRQLAVYCKFASGTVEIIDTSHAQLAEAT